MKVEPRELLDIVADAAKELVEEHSEYSEQILIVMKDMTRKIKNKLFMLDVKDLGLTEEEISNIINSEGENE